MYPVILILLLLILLPSLTLFSIFFLYSLSGYIIWIWKRLHKNTNHTAPVVNEIIEDNEEE